MGRPQLYHTPEEKRAANRLKSKKHYEKKVNKIAQSNGRVDAVPLEREERPRSKLDIIKDQVQRLSQRFERALAQRSTSGYLSLICVGFEIHYEEGYVTRAKDFIMEKELEFRKIQRALEKYQGMVQEISGISEEWKQIEDTAARVREVVHWLDDVLCKAMVEPADLVKRFHAKQLDFQTSEQLKV
ncbi:hypothetical protein H1R20_g8709, partial [Candolleomyces eurysporus]